tara:strand:+ start:343 stop:570 length:228 start_codon:yes stop_codon:yes gene_type:complete
MPEKNGIPFDDLKEGSLKRMLKVKKNDPPLKVGELRALLRGDAKEKTFRGKKVNMTPLLKKRVNLAISLIKMKKK